MREASAYQRRGKPAVAERLCHEILAEAPDHFDAWNMLGVVLYEQHQFSAAAHCFEQAIAINPGNAAARLNLGLPLQRLRRGDEALATYDRALALRPDYPEALLNRGNALLDLGRHEEGLASYDRVLAVRPAHAAALYNRGKALQGLNRHAEALASYDRALALRPDYPEALLNRGIALEDLNRIDESLASYDRALALRPDYARALGNRGTALASRKLWQDAAASFSRLLELAPDHDYAVGNLLKCRLHGCDWEDLPQLAGRTALAVDRGAKAISPFSFLAASGSAAAQLRCARTWFADRHPASPAPMWAGERFRNDRIRVAYLSADFGDHPVSFLTARLFEIHDRRRFEPIAISFRPATEDRMARRLDSAFDRWLDVSGMSDRAVAERLRDLRIDIAVDLMGFTTGSRTGVLACRPAPIQVNYLGYPGTMGAPYIDYIIADEYVVPKGSELHYSEQVVRLPGSFQANDDQRKASAKAPTRAEAGLPETGLVLCSFNKSYKINPPVFDIWMRLLQNVAGSVLWLYADSALVQENLRREAAKRGVLPDRLVFAPLLEYPDHLARCRLADLFLDTLPFNGGATASDLLWSGVPVLTCSGESFASRMGGSILNAAGLPELVTHSLEDYESLALKLASDPAALADVRAKLAGNRASCVLFDSNRLRRHLEAAYVTMWERFQLAEPPASFAVDPLQ